MDLKSLLIKAAQEGRLKQDNGGFSLNGKALWTPEKGVRLTMSNAVEYGGMDVEESENGIRYTRIVSADAIEAIFATKKTRKGS